MRIGGVLVLVLAAPSACGVGEPSGDVRAACTTDEQCGPTQECLFEKASGCDAVGHCFDRVGESCPPAAPAACGCDGTIFIERVGANPANPRPIVSRYPCARTIACSPTLPCPAGLTCAFTIADGCSGSGHCVLRSGGRCLRPPTSYCGCDGTIVMADDADYPAPFAPAPVRKASGCSDAGP